MKNALAALLFSVASLFAQADYSTLLLLSPPAAAGATYLVEEGFEEVDGGGALGGATDGYDSALVAAETGTPNNDYATSPAPLLGSYSAYLDSTSGDKQIRWVLGSSQTTIHAYFQFNDATLPSDANQPIFSISDSGGSDQCQLYSRTAGTLQIFNGGSSGTTVGTLSASTTTHVWVTWSTDGSASVGFSTDGTKPTSGNNYASVAGGSGTAASVRIQLRSVSGTGLQIVYDRLLVDDAAIGSNP